MILSSGSTMSQLIQGYVYFIWIPEMYNTQRYIKIGKAKNPTSRLTQLQTGSPYELQIYGLIQSPAYGTIETQLHRKHHNRRVRREWFELSLEEVDSELAELGGTRSVQPQPSCFSIFRCWR